MLIMNIFVLVCAILSLFFIFKLYYLVKHRAILIFVFSGIVGVLIRLTRVVPTGMFDKTMLDGLVSSMAFVFYITLFLGFSTLYFEVKAFLNKKKTC